MALNETCVFSYSDEVLTEPFRLYNLIYLVFSWTLISVCLVIFYCNRNLPLIQKRTPLMIYVSAVGVIAQTLNGPLWRYDIAVFQEQCLLDNFFALVCIPTVVWPLMIRLIIWANRVKLNFAIAGQVGRKGIKRVEVEASNLKWKVYWASEGFSYVLLGLLIPYYICIYCLLDLLLCVRCELLETASFIIYIGGFVAFALLVIAIVIVYRNAPDNISLLAETKLALSIGGLFSAIGFLFAFADVGHFEQNVPQNFDWAILVDYGFLLCFLVTCPLQVYYGHKALTAPKDRGDKLDDILSTARGKQIFELFLATDLSVENMLFYNAVTEWKREFRVGSQLARVMAKRIATKYLQPGSYLEVNISSSQQIEVREAIEAEDVTLTKDVFDEVLDEVCKLMSSNSVPRFHDSAFYKLYKGEITPEQIPWLDFTGMSVYAMFRRTDRDSTLSLSQIDNMTRKHSMLSALRGSRSTRNGGKDSDRDEDSLSGIHDTHTTM